MYHLKPISIRTAKEFVNSYHRHHKAPQGAKFSIGLCDKQEVLVGIVMVGRPVSRHLDNGYTAEVTRLCVIDGIKNGCSMLYGAAWRTAKGMGYTRIITYILEHETGISLKASGWNMEAESPGGSWGSKKRPRTDKHPTTPKTRWGKEI